MFRSIRDLYPFTNFIVRFANLCLFANGRTICTLARFLVNTAMKLCNPLVYMLIRVSATPEYHQQCVAEAA